MVWFASSIVSWSLYQYYCYCLSLVDQTDWFHSSELYCFVNTCRENLLNLFGDYSLSGLEQHLLPWNLYFILLFSELDVNCWWYLCSSERDICRGDKNYYAKYNCHHVCRSAVCLLRIISWCGWYWILSYSCRVFWLLRLYLFRNTLFWYLYRERLESLFGCRRRVLIIELARILEVVFRSLIQILCLFFCNTYRVFNILLFALLMHVLRSSITLCSSVDL